MEMRELTPEEKARAREAYNAYKREYYKKNKEKLNAYLREYRRKRKQQQNNGEGK